MLNQLLIGIMLLLNVAISSAEIFSDIRFGHVIDNDQKIIDAGLISKDGYSKLCGPTSFENVLVKFRNELGILGTDSLTEIKNLIAVDPAVVQHGILSADYKLLIQNYIQFSLQKSARVDVHVIGAVNFRLEQLHDAIKDHQAIILQLWWWPKLNFNSQNPWSRTPENGHWVAVIGYDSLNPERFLIQDPMHAQPLFINLKAGYPARTNNGVRTYLNQVVTYDIYPPYLNPNETIALVGNYITVQLN